MCELMYVASTCCQLAGVHMYTCRTTTRHFILLPLCGRRNIAEEGWQQQKLPQQQQTTKKQQQLSVPCNVLTFNK